MRLVQIDVLRAKLQELESECVKKGTARQNTIFGAYFLNFPKIIFSRVSK